MSCGRAEARPLISQTVGRASVPVQIRLHRSEQDSRLQSEQGRLCHRRFMRLFLS
jgi:hypothetical protein